MEERTWYISKINNCPLCGLGNVFTGLSSISKRDSVGQAINGLKRHLKDCELKMDEVRVFTSISINTKESKLKSYISSFETNQVMV